MPLATAVLAAALTLIPGRARIPPMVHADYAYMLIAADRLHDGLGYSSLQPIAPHQPWSWRYDFGWLSQWPPVYPWTIVAARKLTGWSTMLACRHLSTLFTAFALVGWFMLIKRAVPRGVTGVVLAAVAAGQAVSTAMLIDPSTDLLLCAAIPYVLMLTGRALGHARAAADDVRHRLPAGMHTGKMPVPHAMQGDARIAWALAGLTAGGLFWIRYAGLFVPTAIGGLLVFSLWKRSVRPAHLAAFAISAAIPVLGLVSLNRAMSSGGSVQETLNLGAHVGFAWSPAIIAEAWWRMTDLGFYDHHWYAHWVFALWPVAAGLLLLLPVVRRSAGRYLSIPTVGLGLASAATLPIMLILAGTLFKGKFDYVGLDRYYAPIRPLYFLLFVGPLLLIPRKWTRAILLIGLCVAGSWTVRQSWARGYQHRLAAHRPATAYGQRSECFNPDASALYDWLREQADPSWVVISNFHDYITLETGIPALPPPADEPALADWLRRIAKARGISHPRVLFVLDPDNKYRGYYLPEPVRLIERFALTPAEDAPPSIAKWVHEYEPAASVRPLAASVDAG